MQEFIPNKLPYSQDIETKNILKQSILANKALAELKGVSGTIPNQSTISIPNFISFLKKDDMLRKFNISNTLKIYVAFSNNLRHIKLYISHFVGKTYKMKKV